MKQEKQELQEVLRLNRGDKIGIRSHLIPQRLQGTIIFINSVEIHLFNDYDNTYEIIQRINAVIEIIKKYNEVGKKIFPKED